MTRPSCHNVAAACTSGPRLQPALRGLPSSWHSCNQSSRSSKASSVKLAIQMQLASPSTCQARRQHSHQLCPRLLSTDSPDSSSLSTSQFSSSRHVTRAALQLTPALWSGTLLQGPWPLQLLSLAASFWNRLPTDLLWCCCIWDVSWGSIFGQKGV